MTKRIGLTGGIACGKSEVQKFLMSQGIPVLDTDRVAHEVMLPGSDVFDAVVDAFGETILGSDGRIDRPSLGKIVFADPDARVRLNRLVHPEVGRRWRAWLEAQTSGLAVVAIPLLFECGLQNEFEGVLCIWAPETIMKQRLLERGLDLPAARQRIQSQWPVDRKVRSATWSICNDRSLSDLHREVADWLRDISPQE